MSYRELGEARILKAPCLGDVLPPKKVAVRPLVERGENWQALDQLAVRLVHGFQPQGGLTRTN